MNTKWEHCEHEWVESLAWEDDDSPNAVVCDKCGCPGERNNDGSVFWPAT